jgi:hypothetical protein
LDGWFPSSKFLTFILRMLTILFRAKTATYMILPILHQGINVQVPVWGRFFDSVNNRLVSEVKKGQIFFSSRFF